MSLALLVPLVGLLVWPVIYLELKAICGREVRRAGRGYIDENF